MADKESRQSSDDNASKSKEPQLSGSPANNSKASPTVGSTRSSPSPNMPPPIPTMAARPSSALSTHSSVSASASANGGSASATGSTPTPGGGQRTTTTSRRGGRTRSRSPVSNVSRPESSTLMGGTTGGASDPYPVANGGPDARSKSPANPSSVAASAAAAAKAFSNSRSAGRGNHQWYDDNQGGRNNSHRGGGDESSSRYQQHQGNNGYEHNKSSGSSKWPSEDGARNGDRNGNKPRRHNGMHERSSSSRGEHYNNYSQHGQGGRGSFDKYNQAGANYDRSNGRHGPRHPYSGQGGRNGQSYPNQYNNGSDRHYHRSSYDGHRRNGRDGRPSSSGMAPVDSRSKTPQSSGADPSSKRGGGGGGTTRVIGTPTPIHVPRAKDNRPNSRQAGAPSSVFRERPSGDVQGEHGPSAGGAVENETHSKLLMSLRTPSTSFEEREKSSSAKNHKSTSGGRGNSPLSPEEPPRIQHSHHQGAQSGGSGDDQNIFFEPQRSPKNSSGTIEMAPSFSLFNHSFDSLGDGPILNVGASLDATFNSTSFGAGPSGSGGNETQSGNQSIQLPTSSFGNPSPGGVSFQGQQQYNLGASSSGGMGLTFGMSPVNSFGNPAAQDQRRNSNMMVLGGSDNRSTSPTEVLGMYQQSYSGGGYGSQGGGPAQSPPFRQMPETMQNLASPNTNGSFGGPAIPYVYTPRSFGGDNSPQVNYHANQSPGNHSLEGGKGGDPSFYVVLKRNKGAFIRCSFLLPGLKGALLESPIKDSPSQTDSKKNKGGSNKQGHKIDPAMSHMGMIMPEPSPQDTAIAMRRVVSAVCAFGGCTPNADHFSKPKPVASDSTQSIFREKKDNNVVTVTPSSTMGTPPGNRSNSKAKYDEMLPSRYYENENRLSWEFEESPPVSSSEDEDDANHKKKESNDTKTKTEDSPETPSREMSSPTPGSQVKSSDGKKTNDSSPAGSDQPKMRYRCKLCGQPKQNHTCPYTQSLQRNIGVMVYPAVNAFTSSEPGLLAPALEEMNNFVSGMDSLSSIDGSPSRPTPERKRHLTQSADRSSKKPTVTPDSLRSGNSQTNSPGSSSLSTVGSPQGTPFRNSPSKSKRKEANFSGGAAMSQRAAGVTPPGSTSRKKRPHSQMQSADEQDLLFVSATELKPEQFRIVTASKTATLPDAYTYPSLPLPYAQRKRLSDNLFALSKEVNQLTDECAVVLREAREKDMWDLAVAELMTQVVVVIHCRNGDNRFEGLRQYLLSLGIAC